MCDTLSLARVRSETQYLALSTSHTQSHALQDKLKSNGTNGHGPTLILTAQHEKLLGEDELEDEEEEAREAEVEEKDEECEEKGGEKSVAEDEGVAAAAESGAVLAELSEESEETCSEESSGEEGGPGPDTELILPLPGYETLGFETVAVPPPAPSPGRDPPDLQGPGPNTVCWTVETGPATRLTEAEARACLLDHVASQVCYGREAAKQMVVTSMESVPAHHYELQSFTEKRETCWSYAAHKTDEVVEQPAVYGAAPLPWEVVEPPSRLFREEVRVVTVPHTGVVRTCHKCRGTGGQQCGDCAGKGWVRCLHCHGDVYLPEGGGSEQHSTDRDRCYYCQHSKHGHGHLECGRCAARGKVSCATCDGSTNILCFIQLSISWRVNTSEHITEKLDIPDDLIRDVSGQVAFEEEHDRVWPVIPVNNEPIKMASAQLVSSHASKFPEEKILRQRHQVRVVPVTKVNYEWKGRPRSFFVYGYEKKVYLPNNSYPQSCCWGCALM